MSLQSIYEQVEQEEQARIQAEQEAQALKEQKEAERLAAKALKQKTDADLFISMFDVSTDETIVESYNKTSEALNEGFYRDLETAYCREYNKSEREVSNLYSDLVAKFKESQARIIREADEEKHRLTAERIAIEQPIRKRNQSALKILVKRDIDSLTKDEALFLLKCQKVQVNFNIYKHRVNDQTKVPLI